ncbi:MAG: zinc-dependent metalloprotease [Polyangiales bacterium]
MRNPTRLLLLFGLAASVFTGCTDGQPAVNRVQPNAMAREALLQGEWYFLQTVIDSPYSASYTFVGEQGSTDKVRFEITEDFLIARRTYEFVDGAEGEGIAGATETGAIVAMYAIQKHFDIRRDYNPVTGEEQNTIVENDFDRPWFERDYVRIDWSQNLITNNDFLVGARLFDGIESEPVSYFVEPGTGHPHEPQFAYDEDGEEGEANLNYMDIVNKMFVRPTTINLPGFGEIPTCFLNSSAHLDCAPGELTIRNSFMRVDESRDYEPMEYTGDRQERFGYFLSDRVGYDPEYGVVEAARLRLVNRHNLWQQSHVRDADGELERCTADDECSANAAGSRCDMTWARTRGELVDGELAGACTIPYREREVRPIAYHLSTNFPEDLISDSLDLSRGWNEAFVETVASLRENECLAEDGADPAACAGERTRADAQEMFVICQNPVTTDDDAACGEPGTSAQIGDLRYNLLGWVAEPHASSPLGYGPSSADPETGEIVMGNAFIYGAAMETLQSFARDIVALINEDVSEDDIASGDVVRAWVERQEEPGSSLTGRTADDHVTSIDGTNVDRVDAAMDFSWVNDFASDDRGMPSSPAEFLARMDQAQEGLARAGAFGRNGGEGGRARLQNLRNTEIERLLAGPEMRLAAGIDPSLDVSDDSVLEQASPLRGMSLRRMNAIERAHQRMHEEGHCVLHADFADEGMLGLARAIRRTVDAGGGTMEWYGQTYNVLDDDGSIDYAAVRQMLRHPIFHGVTSHEIGHTIGLRHNFSGSYDAVNYGPRYWELRDDGDMAPRAWDPETDIETFGRIQENQYSTVMDYGNNFVVTDANGVGHYDLAAIKMGYGDLVEVFTDAPSARQIAWWGWVQQAGWPIPLRLSSFLGGQPSAYQYTDWPEEMGGRANLEARADVAYTSLVPEEYLAGQGIDDPLVDSQGRPVVPYMFCTDHQADLGPDCQRYDSGADAYEAVNSVIDNYWNYYVFNAFGRGRVGFTVDSYANRVHGRYFRKLKSANQIYALYRSVFEDVFGDAATATRFYTRRDGMGAWTAAVGSAFNLFTQVITNPEPGNYAQQGRGDGTIAMLEGNGGNSIDAFAGRGLETRWDQNQGFFWYENLQRVGFFYDKSLALQVLLDPQTNFLGRDTAADVRSYQLSFYTTFGPSTESLMRGLVGADWSSISPRFDGDELIYPDPLNLANLDEQLDGPPVDPNASFSIQLAAAVYGMAMIPETYDRGFFQRSRVWLQNGPEGVTPADDVETVSFTDPETGLVYMAASYPDASGNERGAGAQMIQQAQALLQWGSQAQIADFIDNLNIVRQLSWQLDFGQ